MSPPGEKEVNLSQHPTWDKSSEKDADFHSKDGSAADVAEAQQIASQWVDGTAEEKALVRKLDWRILPCTWVLYLLGFLDRANIRYS